MIENRIVDLVVDSNTPFAYVLKFQDISISITGELEYEVDIDITGATLKGVIKKSLDPTDSVLTTFDTNIATPKLGVATISLSQDKVKILSSKASIERDKYNNRLRFVGYYDILMTMPNKQPVRILEGTVYISDGVTI